MATTYQYGLTNGCIIEFVIVIDIEKTSISLVQYIVADFIKDGECDLPDIMQDKILWVCSDIIYDYATMVIPSNPIVDSRVLDSSKSGKLDFKEAYIGLFTFSNRVSWGRSICYQCIPHSKSLHIWKFSIMTISEKKKKGFIMVSYYPCFILSLMWKTHWNNIFDTSNVLT